MPSYSRSIHPLTTSVIYKTTRKDKPSSKVRRTLILKNYPHTEKDDKCRYKSRIKHTVEKRVAKEICIFPASIALEYTQDGAIMLAIMYSRA